MRALALLLVLAVPSIGSGLKEVRSIFVDSLGDTAGAATIREKIIKKLAKSRSVSLVVDPEKADAILTGTGWVSEGRDLEGNRTYHAAAGIQLITKDRQILWADLATPGGFFGGSVSSSVADKIATHLLKAIETDQRAPK